MKKLLLCLSLFFSASFALLAAPPSGYYNVLNGISSPAELKTAISNLVLPHTTPPDLGQTYSAYYNNLPAMFRQTDVRPGTNFWWDMYSNLEVETNIQFGQYMNREHSFPKSWWGGDQNIPAYVDLNHLYPGEARANQAKSNYPLGVVDMSQTSGLFNNGVTRVGKAVYGQGGGAAKVFEPADEYKGDFARTYFYMVTAYQDLTWATNYMFMLQQNTYPTLTPWAYELLLQWSKDDPVSQKEITRNNAVYAIQGNRNPFIDIPGLEQYIWGSKQGTVFNYNEAVTTTDPELSAPIDGMALDFGQCAVDDESTRSIFFKGSNIRGSVSLILTGPNAAEFSIEASTLSADLINDPAGYNFRVTYAPRHEGVHTANLTVYDIDGWGAGSLNVTLRGEGEEIPHLTQLVALPASDITSTSYTANWNPAPEVVDYYIVNRTRYVDGLAQSQPLLAETNSLVIDDYDPAVPESYTVQSVRLNYRSQPSNSITVGAASIQGIDADEPLVVEAYPEGLVVMLPRQQSNLRIFDMTGRLLYLVRNVDNCHEFALPLGAYFVVTDQHRTPVKVLVR